MCATNPGDPFINNTEPYPIIFHFPFSIFNLEPRKAMIYFDNSATTLMKPPEVAEAVAYAIGNFGNPGRSFYGAALLADREIYRTRAEIARLVGLDEPLNVAFTSSFTEGLNLVSGGLVSKGDSVVTTVTEHNSVLRPLYLSGCELRFIDCDERGALSDASIGEHLRAPAKYLFCSHGSNLTGNIADARKLRSLCKENGITMVLDVSQTLGMVPVDVGMADILVFSGHKWLFGPQGTGGVIVNGKFDFKPVKAGGSGTQSFSRGQSKEMPDVFEAGSPNGHGIYGLQKGVGFINETGVERINAKATRLAKLFYDSLKDARGVRFYGDFSTENRLPVIAMNVEGISSGELSLQLWEGYGIATRPGIHCSPLLHERMGTADTGMVRFSFSYFNEEEEVATGVEAVKEIAKAN